MRIFLAHAKEDKAQVKEVYAALKAHNLEPWLDSENILAGQNWRQEILKAMRDSDLIVAFFSSRSVAQKGYRHKEVRMALQFYAETPPGSIHLIPVRLDSCEIPDYYQADIGSLRDVQWIDYWEPDFFARLLRSIEAKSGETVSSSALKFDTVAPASHTHVSSRRVWRVPHLIAIIAIVFGALVFVMYLALYGPLSSPTGSPAKGPEERKVAAQEKPANARPAFTRDSLHTPIVRSPRPRESVTAVPSSLPAPVNNSEALIVDTARLPFVSVPGGSFLTGATQVTLRPFQMSATEVTQQVWQEVMGDNPSDFKGDDLPVHNVSWKDAQAFVHKLNQRRDGFTYRLPTEAEWEYAAKANSPTPTDLMAMAWLGLAADPARHGVQPVATKSANRWKLFDMFGNVAEWCEDPYESGYERVTRGGSWMDSVSSLRTSDRAGVVPTTKTYAIGVRLVRTSSK